MKRCLYTIAIVCSLTHSVGARAEYRMYQYYVKSPSPSSIDRDSYVVESTLDPVSYIAYHGGKEAIKLQLLRTWMCYGHTGRGKEPCPSPLEGIVEQIGRQQTTQ